MRMVLTGHPLGRIFTDYFRDPATHKKGGAFDMASTQAEADGRGVGSDRTQTAPARHETILFGAHDQPVVESWNGDQGQL